MVPDVVTMSLCPETAGSAPTALDLKAVIRSAEEMRRPIQVSDARPDDYDAVYFPGRTVRWRTCESTRTQVDC